MTSHETLEPLTRLLMDLGGRGQGQPGVGSGADQGLTEDVR